MEAIIEDTILTQGVIKFAGKNVGESFTGGVTKREKKGMVPRSGYSSYFPKGETLILRILLDFFFFFNI